EVKSEIRKYVNVYEIGKVYEGSGIEIKSYKNVILYL
ncbi:phosphoribosylformylglycinamidine cyclo-ligase, partial [Sulfolobus sp. F1]